MKHFLSLAAAATALTTLPAAAQTYDAFSSFTGTHTGGAFTYGVYDGTNFTAYNDAPGCENRISGVTCTSNGDLPAAYKTTEGAHQSGSVLVPGNALLLHPGPNAGETSALIFTAPISSDYRFSFSAFIADTNPSGVNLEIFIPGVAGANATFATLTAANPTFLYTTVVGGVLPAGFQFGFAIDNDGSYYNDSTGVNFTLTAVPEPATWAMMVIGFGMVGFGLRYRRKGVRAAIA